MKRLFLKNYRQFNSFPIFTWLNPSSESNKITFVFLNPTLPVPHFHCFFFPFYFVRLVLPSLLCILFHRSVVQFYYRWPDFQCAVKTASADRLVLDSHSERTAVWCPGIELEAITKAFGWTREKRKEKKKNLFSEDTKKTAWILWL